MSRAGELSGVSATGVALTGKSTLPKPERGKLKLADGTRLKFDVIADSADSTVPLRPGLIRAIILADGLVQGVGQIRGTARNAESFFFIRSARSG